jgi:hypothetical protein
MPRRIYDTKRPRPPEAPGLPSRRDDEELFQRLENEETQRLAAAALSAIGDIPGALVVDALTAALARQLASTIPSIEDSVLFAEGCGRLAGELIRRKDVRREGADVLQ